jgi:hypothetical protein
MPFLSAAEYPAIRAAIDISLDAESLPDAVIGSSVYQDAAERWVLVANPDAATYAPGTSQYDLSRVAAINACAAMIAPAVPTLTRESYGDGYSYQREALATKELVDTLWSRAREAIAEATGSGGTVVDRVPSRFVFGRITGRRRV